MTRLCLLVLAAMAGCGYGFQTTRSCVEECKAITERMISECGAERIEQREKYERALLEMKWRCRKP